MNLGNAILDMMGNKDPRDQLLQAMLGGTPVTAGTQPLAGAGTPGGAGGTPATTLAASTAAPPAAPAVAQAYQSPPDLVKLYSAITDRNRREDNIDSGIGLIASSFAQPENRQAIQNSMVGNHTSGGGVGGGSGSGGGDDPLSLIMGIQQKQVAMQEKQRKLAELPAIAAKYGLDPATARNLLDNDQLDDFVVQASKPDNNAVVLPDGTTVIVNENTGQQVGPVFGTPKPNNEIVQDGTGQSYTVNRDTGQQVGGVIGAAKPQELKFVEDPATGQQIPVDPITGKPSGGAIGGVKPPETQIVKDDATGVQTLVNKATGENIRTWNSGPEATADMKELEQVNADRTKRGLSPIPPETWFMQSKSAAAPKTTVNNAPAGIGGTALVENMDKDIITQRGVADGAVATIGSLGAARKALAANGGIVAGSVLSPVELETRKVFADAFGIDDPAVVNSAEFSGAMASTVLSKVKQLGTGNSISNADREYTEKAVGASNQIPQAAIPKILNILELGSRNEIIKYNDRVKARLDALPKDPNTGLPDPTVAQALRPLPVPPISQAWLSSVPVDAIKELAAAGNDPKVKSEFDEVFGLGAANAVLESQ